MESNNSQWVHDAVPAGVRGASVPALPHHLPGSGRRLSGLSICHHLVYNCTPNIYTTVSSVSFTVSVFFIYIAHCDCYF